VRACRPAYLRRDTRAMGGAPLFDVDGIFGPAGTQLVLYKEPLKSAGLLAGSTVAYYLLELSGLTYVSLVTTAALVLTLAALMWAAASNFIKVPGPPVLMTQVDDKAAADLAKALVPHVNAALFLMAKLMSGKHVVLSLKAVGVLWVAAKVGSWFHFNTFLYMAVLLAFTLPKLYVTFQREADEVLAVAGAYCKELYATGDEWLKVNVVAKLAPHAAPPKGAPAASDATATSNGKGAAAADSAEPQTGTADSKKSS